MVERELIDFFINNAEQRLFQDFKSGTVETRRHTGYALDALKVLGSEIKASINEAVRNVRRSEPSTGSGRP